MGTTAEKLAYLDATKTAIKDAIIAKGVEIPEGTTFRQYADLISGISTGLSDEDLAKATATPEDVTAGKTFYAGNREMKTGTAEKGLVLKQTYTGLLSASNSLEFNINSNTFLVFGGNHTSRIYIYYERGTQILLSYNSAYIDADLVKIFDSKYQLTLKTGILVSSVSFESANGGNSPLYIFEG